MHRHELLERRVCHGTSGERVCRHTAGEHPSQSARPPHEPQSREHPEQSEHQQRDERHGESGAHRHELNKLLLPAPGFSDGRTGTRSRIEGASNAVADQGHIAQGIGSAAEPVFKVEPRRL